MWVVLLLLKGIKCRFVRFILSSVIFVLGLVLISFVGISLLLFGKNLISILFVFLMMWLLVIMKLFVEIIKFDFSDVVLWGLLLLKLWKNFLNFLGIVFCGFVLVVMVVVVVMFIIVGLMFFVKLVKDNGWFWVVVIMVWVNNSRLLKNNICNMCRIDWLFWVVVIVCVFMFVLFFVLWNDCKLCIC